MWPWCNLAASQRRPYCASLNNHSPVGLVSRQWDAVDWACVLCDCRIQNDWASRSALHDNVPAHSTALLKAIFDKASHHSSLSAPLQPRFGSLGLLAFPKAKIVFEMEILCECNGHTVHRANQRPLTADWLAPRENEYSRMRSKVFSAWLSNYIKPTRLVLEIFKMDGYFPDSPCIE
jgi:hypothetical protein